MTVLAAVDVGGSGMRSVLSVDGVTGPVRTDQGARIGAGGLDVTSLVAATAAGLPDTPVDVLVFGARGIMSLASPDEVLRQLLDLDARRTVVCIDAVTALVGAIGSVRPGAVVAAGAGAIAFGSDFNRRYRRVDGWGFVLGDRGSAAAIGLRGLQSVVRACDNGAALADLPMGSAALQHFGPQERWPQQVMSRKDATELLAGFAPTVTAAAATDPEALRICRDAGAELADSLLTAATGLPTDAPLSYTGGVFGAEVVLSAFLDAVAGAGRAVNGPAGDALAGGLLLAERMLHDPLPARPPFLLVG
ncbi:BadF/BadG/BcrA/BcrD ATPase family protein [Nakamurella lactea]|uniref:BadF/BadG/BcrA/BcrD ATPase family protein n=1 Tax=Nakamurella lactea TaxID=459515 RepID=UPI00040D63D8|nr:BadF/BadG/BcrA/BcrD ATPase family protein [Nakamurella lactea]